MTKSDLRVPAEATRLLFHYDVNTDGVDDLFFGGWANDSGDARVTVLHSHLSDEGALTFEPADCSLELPLDGRAYFVRDLNSDGTRDLVIGTTRGVRALVNHEDGPETVLEYRFPNSEMGMVSLLDVVVGDFDGDASDDLAVGFDRATDELGTLQTGTLLFSDVAGAGVDSEPLALRITDWSAATVGAASQPPRELGYLAAFDDGRSLFGLVTSENGGTEGWAYRDGELSPLPIVGTLTSIGTFVQSTVLDGREHLFIGAGTLHAFDPLIPDGPGATHYDAPGAYARGLLDRELGGGVRQRGFFLLDLDGDGDDDLVERRKNDRGGDSDGSAFAFHNGDGMSGIFADFVEHYWLYYADPGSESPFLAIGELEGRLMVSGASPWTDLPLPSVRALLCSN